MLSQTNHRFINRQWVNRLIDKFEIWTSINDHRYNSKMKSYFENSL